MCARRGPGGDLATRPRWVAYPANLPAPSLPQIGRAATGTRAVRVPADLRPPWYGSGWFRFPWCFCRWCRFRVIVLLHVVSPAHFSTSPLWHKRHKRHKSPLFLPGDGNNSRIDGEENGRTPARQRLPGFADNVPCRQDFQRLFKLYLVPDLPGSARVKNGLLPEGRRAVSLNPLQDGFRVPVCRVRPQGDCMN